VPSFKVSDAARRSTRTLYGADGNLGGMKVRDLIRRLEEDGWRQVRTRGSHRQFQHSVKPGTVTVAGKPSIDVPPGTLNSILKSAGLKKP
jgi:predicted RNA binding protein YcfA (HicA-like mRNA interferase family)/predicted RNase H-like HicB family nuclease